MPGPYKEAARRLHEIAQPQQGFFTTKQAIRSGFAEKTHSCHVNAGKYAVIHLNDTALLRDTWTWLLGHWLATSGRREKNAQEYERFTNISEAGTPIGPVEIWIPLELLARD